MLFNHKNIKNIKNSETLAQKNYKNFEAKGFIKSKFRGDEK